jgi:lipopolysaccharide export system protein LptA
LSGSAGRPAVADSAEARIEAPAIAIATDSEGLSATGGLTCLLKPGDGGRRIGFFPACEDVLISCEALEARPGTATTRLVGDVLIRQGGNSVRGDEIELSGDSGRMSGGGGTAVTIIEAGTAGGPGRTVELAGGGMAYRPEARTLSFSAGASIRLPEANLEAGTVAAVLSRDGRSLESLTAGPAVTVTKGRFEGRAEAAFYDAAGGRLELSGKPVLTDGKGGSARGAKLTFDLADDKILIENEGPGRATTIVRS